MNIETRVRFDQRPDRHPFLWGFALKSVSLCGFAAIFALISAFMLDRARSEEGRPQFKQLPNAVLEGSVLLQSGDGSRVEASRCHSVCADTVGCRGYSSTPDGACVLYSTVLGHLQR